MKGNIVQFGNFFHQNSFSELILSWFKKNQRHLYWRDNRSIYLTYLTEIMLQQTTVKTVENKLKIYLDKFPNFKSYKAKTLEDLLSSWSGLGYYNRAENLFKSINIINENYKGKLPSKKSELIALPGIGQYTANAIISIGFNEKAYPVDVNVRRLLTRILDFKLTDEELERVLDISFKNKKNFRNFSESMMDYSSSICKKSSPLCPECIFSKFCKSAYKKFDKKITKKIKKQNLEFYIIKKNNLFCFIKDPNFQFYKKFIHLPSNLDKKFISLTKFEKKEKIMSFNYSITNHKFKINVYSLKDLKISYKNIQWVNKNELTKIALPTLFKKILS